MTHIHCDTNASLMQRGDPDDRGATPDPKELREDRQDGIGLNATHQGSLQVPAGWLWKAHERDRGVDSSPACGAEGGS